MGGLAGLKVLLDTHVWLWRLLAPERVSPAAERALMDPGNLLHLSPVSTWETLVLAGKGRVVLEPSPAEWVVDALQRSSLRAAPLTHRIAILSERLDGFGSADPADRFLVATALDGDLVLVTADDEMRAYEAVQTLW